MKKFIYRKISVQKEHRSFPMSESKPLGESKIGLQTPGPSPMLHSFCILCVCVCVCVYSVYVCVCVDRLIVISQIVI